MTRFICAAAFLALGWMAVFAPKEPDRPVNAIIAVILFSSAIICIAMTEAKK